MDKFWGGFGRWYGAPRAGGARGRSGFAAGSLRLSQRVTGTRCYVDVGCGEEAARSGTAVCADDRGTKPRLGESRILGQFHKTEPLLLAICAVRESCGEIARQRLAHNRVVLPGR